MKNTISTIVVSYGRSGILAQTISDLLEQARQPDEIIVVHQCPEASDGTECLRTWGKEGKILLHEPDLPHAEKARNWAISKARGKYLLFLDDDIRAPRDLVERHLVNYERDPTLDGVVGQILEPNQQPTMEIPFHCKWKRIGWMFFPLNYAERIPVVNWPSTNSSLRRDLAVRSGGFDEQFDRTWFDDTDISCRLRKLGAKLVFDPSASIIHLKHPGGGRRNVSSSNLWMDRHAWAIYFYFWRKNFGLFKVMPALWWNVRYIILRRAVVSHPLRFGENVRHLISGYHMASQRLREGPRYFSFL